MIRLCLPLVLLLSTTALHAQQRLSAATARRAIDFATWQHSERVLRTKMDVLCPKPNLFPKEKAWCLLWNAGLSERLASVRQIDQTPPYDTLAQLLRPFSATRLEAAAFHSALRTPLGRGDSVETQALLATLRARLVGPDSGLLEPVVAFLRGAAPAPPAGPDEALALPEAVVQPDTVVPVPSATPWKIATALTGLLTLLGWGYALVQRGRTRDWREKTERLQRELHEQKAHAWFGQLSALRSRDEESTDRRF